MTVSRPVRSAPTYSASGLLGSLTGFRRDPLDLLMRGFRELGDVVHFQLFTRDLVLVAHPNDVRWVLQENTGNYNKRTRGFEVLQAFLREGLLTSEGDHWLRQRRIAQPAFHHKRIATFGNAMTGAAGDLVDRWQCASAPAVVNVTAEMMRLTLRIVDEALLSTDVSHEADRVGQALNITLRRRQCIGNSFAMMELVLVVTTIAQRCALDLPPGETVGTSPSITLRAATPIRMRVGRRSVA